MRDLTTLSAEKVARVRGNLEGYADALEKFGLPREKGERTKASLITSLRENAATLGAVLSPEEQTDDHPEGKNCAGRMAGGTIDTPVCVECVERQRHVAEGLET